MVEGLFEHVRLEELAAGAEKLVKGFPGLAPDVSLAREKDELLAGQEPLEASGGLTQLGLAGIVAGFQQMANDVELVVDDLDAWAVGLEAVAEGPPHVHDGVGDELGAVLAEPLPERAQGLFLATLDHAEQFWAAQPFQGADHGPLVLAFAHGDLIGAQDRDAIPGPLSLDRPQGLLVEGLHRGPMQQHQRRDDSHRHHLTQLCHQGRQRTSDHGAIRGERQGLQGQAALGAGDSVAADPQEGRVFPQGQVLDFDPPRGMRLPDWPTALLAGVWSAQPLDLQDHGVPASARLHRHRCDAVPWKSEQFPEIRKGHRVGPPVCPLPREQRDYTLLDAPFSAASLHKNLS